MYVYMHLYTYTVFPLLNAAVSIKFQKFRVQRILKGGVY